MGRINKNVWYIIKDYIIKGNWGKNMENYEENPPVWSKEGMPSNFLRDVSRWYYKLPAEIRDLQTESSLIQGIVKGFWHDFSAM